MTLQPRDRRALILCGVAIAGILIYRIAATDPAVPETVRPAESSEVAEKRLARVRQMAGQVPAKEELLKQARADLLQREKGLLDGETAAQAQAQLISIVRKVGREEAPPVEIRSTEIGPVRPLGDAYGEVLVSMTVDCRIDQLVNLLSSLAAQPEIVATSDLRVGAARAKDKIINVRMTVSGVVPKRLVPERKGPSL